MRQLWVGFVSLLLLFSGAEKVAAQLDHLKLQQFKLDHPRAYLYGGEFENDHDFIPRASSVNTMYGTILAQGATPLESAWNLVVETQGIFVTQRGELRPAIQASGKVLQGVMYNREDGTHKFHTFRFNQVFNGIPVFRSGIGFLTRNEPGNPVVMAGFNLKELAGFAGAPKGERPKVNVTEAMIQNVRQLMDAQPILRSVLDRAGPRQQLQIKLHDERLVIWAGLGTEQETPELAVVFVAERGSAEKYPDYQKYLMVASVNTGEILLSETQIQNFTDIDGNVSGRATDGIGAWICHSENPFSLPYAEVEVVGGNTAFADENGDFTISHGGNSEVTVRSYLRGTYFEVFDVLGGGGATPFIDQRVTPPGPANFLHNPDIDDQFPTANVNAYLHANLERDYVLFFEPTFPEIDTQMSFRINTNIDQTCNAFYNGSSINFFHDGGCPNTAYSDIVYHEYGHHLISVTQNGQGQMGEGTGDTVGVLIQDEPILGHGWSQDCESGLRNADNNKQYPCMGQIHDCGQLLSGCIWDTRNELILTEPVDYQDINSSLFFGMLIVRGQMEPSNNTITPFIALIYLELDDDDGNLENGTPHYQEIAAGFGAHNMEVPALNLFDFSYPNGRPVHVSPNGGVAFTVEVIEVFANLDPDSGKLHVDSGNGFEEFPLNEIGPGIYEAVFPANDCGTLLQYYLTFQSTDGFTQFEPSTAPSQAFEVLTGFSSVVVLDDNFESDLGWIVSGDASEGHWVREVPVLNSFAAAPKYDADGSGKCFLTNNTGLPGISDVDDGSTILTSAIFDASGPKASVSLISYYRWFSNTYSYPREDSFLVEISNDGGNSWVTLEEIGPDPPETSGEWFHPLLRINDFVEPTDQMKVRFTASDLGGDSVIEAAVDGVKVIVLDCNDGQTFVPPATFSVFRGNTISAELSDFELSDDVRARFNPGFVVTSNEAPIWLVFDAVATTAFDLLVESQAGTPGLSYTAEAFNWNTNQYDTIGVDSESFNADSVATYPLVGVDHIDVDGNVRARVGWRKTGLTVNFPWEVRVDQVGWNE